MEKGVVIIVIIMVAKDEDGCKISCYFKVSLSNKTNKGDIGLFRSS